MGQVRESPRRLSFRSLEKLGHVGKHVLRLLYRRSYTVISGPFLLVAAVLDFGIAAVAGKNQDDATSNDPRHN